jgi:hypothetical protein
MKFENTKVWGIQGAIIGMRLPLNRSFKEASEKSDSWHPGNSGTDCPTEECDCVSLFELGEDDKRICKNLIKADSEGFGQPNGKFLRMIHVQVCITAPEYFCRELDTYKVGTVRNSSSTMHKLASTPITLDCFEMEDFEHVSVTGYTTPSIEGLWVDLVENLEKLRQKYIETKDKQYWKELVRLLPSSWLYTFMFDCDYATLRNIYHWRKNHKLVEWHKFCEWIETLPFAKELICE